MKRVYTVIILLSITAAAAAFYRKPVGTLPHEQELSALPEQIGAWTKTGDIAFDKGVLDLLGTRNAFGTLYKDPAGRTVRVVIVQAVNNRSAFHPPEYCLTGGGSEVIAKRIREVPLSGGNPLRVNEMVFIAGRKDRFFVWNWYAAGKDTTENFYRQQLGLVWRMIRSRHAKGTMVNLFAVIGPNESADDVTPIIQDFTRSLMPCLSDYL